jgi:hypothetical protein
MGSKINLHFIFKGLFCTWENTAYIRKQVVNTV